MMSSSSVQALYAHIHRLLDEHVAEHLTTDYMDCTQLRVFQTLTGSLLPISVDDPHSLVLPSDPLDDFVKEHCQIEMKDMCERLPGTTKSQKLIFHTMHSKPVERTIAINFDDNFCGYCQSTDVFADPPVLSVDSIRHTPKPGSSKIRRFIPLNLKEVLSLNTMVLPSAEEEIDADTQTKDVLHCRLAVDPHSWKEILLSYQASPFLTTHTNRTESMVCNKFLCRTPSPPLLAPLPQTPPLFSGTNVATKKPAYVHASMSDLQLVATSTSSDSDEGALEYMAVNDEWAASSTLSPPTSLNNSPSKRDVFFVPSSEPQGPIDDLLAAEMDMFHVPRQSRVGGSCETFKVLGQGQQLHEYIGRAVCLTRGRNTIATTTPTSDAIVTPLTSVHHVDGFPTPDNMCQSSDDSEDAFLGQLRLDFPDEAISAILLDQTTDTQGGLMDVPQLPAPNVHGHNIHWLKDMKSLVTYMGSSAFIMLKGIKSLNLELTWRPYGSEQAIPTIEELVGDSELPFSLANISVGVEARSQLAELLKWLDSLTQPVSIEEESQRKLQVLLKSLTDTDFVTVDPGPSDCELSNILPTREERLRSRFRRTQLKRTYDHAGLWDGDGYTVQPQGPGRSKVVSPSEAPWHLATLSTPHDFVQNNNHEQSTEPNLVDSGVLVRGCALLPDHSEDEAIDAQVDIVSAPHVQLPMESITSLSPACLSLRSPNSDSISSLESPRGPAPDRIHLSQTGGFESNHEPTSSSLATLEEQSLRGYLKVLAKQHASGQADNDKRFTSPDRSELRRPSTSPVDTEGLLRDLSKLAAPLPPMEASPRRNHRYLASVELLQDRPLMRALRYDSLRMELLEREWVDGADIVFDCDTALVFASLFQVSLPTSFRSLKDRLSSLSWRYTDLAVIFKLDEASISGLQRPQDEEEGMDLFARVIRSIKKLQRELALAEAYAIKRPQTVIQMFFVRSAEQAAATARLLGDVAEARSQFSPWGDRLWLGVDEKEEERYLAGVDGMNAFAAAVILSQMTLHDFLALEANQRLQLLLQIPASMMEQFNAVIVQRREDVDTLVEDVGGAY